MKAINDFRLALGLWKINAIKNPVRQSRIIPYDQVKQIVILLPINGASDIALALQIAAEFKVDHKTCRIIGFTDTRKPEGENKPFEMLYRDDLHWDYIPKGKNIKDILLDQPDILINFCTELCIPLAYIAAISKSFFKIGKYHPKLAGCYDFMLQSQQNSTNGLLAEIKHYLYTIK